MAPRLLGLVLALPLAGQSWDTSLGLAIQRRPEVPYGPARLAGRSQVPLALRVSVDGIDLPQGLQGIWTAAAFSGNESEYRFRAVALGFGLTRRGTGPMGLHGGLGAELRIQAFEGKDLQAWHPIPSQPPYTPWNPQGSYSGHTLSVPLGGVTAWEIRPYLRAHLGWRGILLPLGHLGELLWYLTQGGKQIHPITQVEVGLPLGRRGGDGVRGTLLHMAPGAELTVAFGIRVGRS